MERIIKIGGAALNQLPLDWRGNRARIVEAIRLARRQQIQLLCLPELCISGYGCEDAFHGESVAVRSLESLGLLLPETGGLAVAVGLPLLYEGRLYNAAALLTDGRIAGFSAKRVLAGHGVYYEPRWFQPWPDGVAEELELELEHDGRRVPIGDLTFDLNGVLVGFEICEDAWGRGQAGLTSRPVDILLNPSASHFAHGKYSTLQGVVKEGSRVSHAAYLHCNLAGNEAGRLIFDGAVMIASNGLMLAENSRFSFKEVSLVAAVVDLQANRLEKRRLGYPARPDEKAGRVTVPFSLKEPGEAPISASRPSTDSSATSGKAPAPLPPALGRNEEFARAVSLGLWDYLRKSGCRGFAVSLSGGVDSACVAVLCWTMAGLALEELGREAVMASLGLPAEPSGVSGSAGSGGDTAGIVAGLLTTAYQATANSSAQTRQAAAGLAGQLGSRHLELELAPLVEGYERLAEQALGRKLDWEHDDIARQNIQARVRSPGIWLVANLEGLLLLSTSNRSEVGVGYTTMDGDTSGGLAPIAGANKSFLRGWLNWMEREGLPGLGPLSSLGAINSQPPTAELRPPHAAQTDEKDLMPYPVLDAIEQAAIRDRKTPLEVWRTLLAAPPPGPALPAATAAGYVAKFFRLWSRTQWKRERLAPSFHLDDENLDPRTWCRYPILSGGYKEELEELRREAEGEQS